MGGDWGSTGVPDNVTAIYNAYQGADGYADTADFSGSPIYPTYNMREAIQAAWASNAHPSPYESITLHDPNPDMDDALARFEDYDAIVSALSPLVDWQAVVDGVVAKVDEQISWTDNIDDLVTQYDVAQTPEMQRSAARTDAALANINAGSHAFFMGKAMVEAAHNNSLAAHRTQLLVTNEQQRRSMIIQGVQQAIQFVAMQHDGQQKAIAFRMDLARQNIVANNDLIANQLNLDVQAEKWNMGLLGAIKSVDLVSSSPVVNSGTPGWVGVLGTVTSVVGGLASAGGAIAGGVAAIRGMNEG